jgi:hypothetical protein
MATRPIDLQRGMNDPAAAAVIFVEQPEGLCGLTNVRLSTRVISASIVDRKEQLNEEPLLVSDCGKATPMTREPTPLGHVMIRCAESGEGVPGRYESRSCFPQEQQPHRADLQVSALWARAHVVGEDAWVEDVY